MAARAQNGSAAAFCRLVEEHQARLFRQALAMCRDRHAAEDLVQETLVEAWKSLSRYNHTCRLSTWLYSILLHRHQKALRRARSRPALSEPLSADTGDEGDASTQKRLEASDPSPMEAMARQETRAGLRQAIDAMPETLREVIRLRFFGDASLREIGEVLDIPLGTVKSRLHNGLEKLRQMTIPQ